MGKPNPKEVHIRQLHQVGTPGSIYSIIPRDFIDRLGWKKKDHVRITLNGKKVILEKMDI